MDYLNQYEGSPRRPQRMSGCCRPSQQGQNGIGKQERRDLNKEVAAKEEEILARIGAIPKATISALTDQSIPGIGLMHTRPLRRFLFAHPDVEVTPAQINQSRQNIYTLMKKKA